MILSPSIVAKPQNAMRNLSIDWTDDGEHNSSDSDLNGFWRKQLDIMTFPFLFLGKSLWLGKATAVTTALPLPTEHD
jgi:hypothetical protein